MEEARLLAADALEEVILHYLAEGMPIPLPRAANKGEEAVALDPISAGRAAVAILMAQGHISNVALASWMAKDEKVVRRIVSGKGNVTMHDHGGAESAGGEAGAGGVRPISRVASSGRTKSRHCISQYLSAWPSSGLA
jgi:hypothetical protein